MAERIAKGSEYDVVWYERHDRFGASLRVAPLSVSGLLREKLFADRSVVLTSATLKLGGDFNGVGASLGLAPEGTEGRGRARSGRASTSARPSTTPSRASSTSPGTWPRPAGTATARDMLDELAELIEAAGGRTLGLFSSMRAAQAAAEELRGRLGHARSCSRARRRSAS